MMACMNNLIASTLESITLGAPTVCDSITMFPLMGPGAVEQEPFYLTLDQALGDGWTEITEMSEQGSVPELRVTNKGTKPVFILDGEELVGAKQNRVVNLTILVPAKTTLNIPGVVLRRCPPSSWSRAAAGQGGSAVEGGRVLPGRHRGCRGPRSGCSGDGSRPAPRRAANQRRRAVCRWITRHPSAFTCETGRVRPGLTQPDPRVSVRR